MVVSSFYFWYYLFFSLLVTSLSSFFIHKYWYQYIKGYATLVYNFLFLTFFLLSANYYKNILILDRLQKHNINYAYVNSFLYSIGIAAEEYQFNSHAAFYKNGNLYLWSYRDLEFYICPENARNNIAIPRSKLYREENKNEDSYKLHPYE
jgi:hypothetical protein